MRQGPVAVMDAAIAYGAQRYFDSVHSNHGWPYRSSYDEYDDSLLFFEFLHYVIAYDRIVLDNSSVTEVNPELRTFLSRVNSHVGFEWITTEDLGSRSIGYPIEFVQTSVCRLLAEAIKRGILTEQAIENTPIPWAYKRQTHHDYSNIAERVQRFNMSLDIIPFILFVWRGMVYAAFANYQARHKGNSYVYIAAPGRVTAMKTILSRAEVHRVEYPREALQELISDLQGLPIGGYDFSLFQSVPPYARSPFSGELSGLDRHEALSFASDFRNQSQTQNLRIEWSQRLFERASSCAVGATYRQSIKDATVEGNVTQVQIIHATPYDY